MVLRGAFYDPLAGGCRTPNPEPSNQNGVVWRGESSPSKASRRQGGSGMNRVDAPTLEGRRLGESNNLMLWDLYIQIHILHIRLFELDAANCPESSGLVSGIFARGMPRAADRHRRSSPHAVRKMEGRWNTVMTVLPQASHILQQGCGLPCLGQVYLPKEPIGIGSNPAKGGQAEGLEMCRWAYFHELRTACT